MQTDFSPSVNILRDESVEMGYIVTSNARKVAKSIEVLPNKGFRCFSIIGSYGSGKSSFLWALERDLKGDKDFFQINLGDDYNFIKLIGEYGSLKDGLEAKFSVSSTKALFKKLKSTKTTIILLDEFGKYIEYAVRNQPEKEIYFFQQLAEFVADPKNNCILISTLHQSFDAYSGSFLNAAERNEWRKVKGRFKDLTFNEPVDQLLYLAAKRIDSKSADQSVIERNLALQAKHSITKSDAEFLDRIGSQLWPLDIFSSYLLAVGLQRYGQNERSLFTFLEGEFDKKGTQILIISDIYDYLHHEFFSYLKSDKNYDYNAWRSISIGIERTETIFNGDVELAQKIIKTIGLISLLGHKGARMNEDFFVNYLTVIGVSKKQVTSTLRELESKKIVLFTKYNNAYRIIEGTDVDFAEELKAADLEIDDRIDIPTKLKESFQFSVLNAKSISYQLGTPRFFEYVITENPLEKIPDGQIDGFINLIFNDRLGIGDITSISEHYEETIYAYFKNVQDVKELLIDIERTNKAKAKNHDDKQAVIEFDIILNSQKLLLNRNVIDALFSDHVLWFQNGKEISIRSNKELNQLASEVCRSVYTKTPVFKNELINRHILSGAVGAKKPYFASLAKKYHQEDLGYPSSKFPADKTIYLTLLKQTGIHHKDGSTYGFKEPDKYFAELWNTCEEFIVSSKKEAKNVSELYEILSKKPFKLAPGFLEFWIPSYLFIKRDDFALFSKDEGYQPEITESHLHFLTRDAHSFEIKAFDVQGIKLDLYNKYRELLQLRETKKVNNESLIESVKPFMVFYHQLNEYAKNTSKVSSEAKALRVAIKNAKDPEKLFFEEFPKATKTELTDLLASEELFEEYIKKIRSAIRSLQACYSLLLDRVELFIVNELLNQRDLNFADYKQQIELRFRNLKEHMLIPEQTAFLIRLRTPLNDRESWINSLCHVIMGKKLDVLTDKEENIFKDKLKRQFHELDNMAEISNENVNEGEKVLKIDISTLEEGTREMVIRLPSNLDDEALDAMNNVKKALGKNKNLNKFILANLLKQLDDKT